MVAELTDLMPGQETWNEAGRRSIRMDQIAAGISGRRT